MNSKKNTNNNPLLSIGSESQYSETSDFQSGGGIMNWLLGSGSGEYATELALDAFKNQYPQIAYFIIRHAIDKSVQLDFSKSDTNKRTLLHHLVSYAKIPVMKDLFSIVLSNTDAKRYINAQDENGDTPAHLAAHEGSDMVIDELVAHGANLTIANNANKVIHIESGNAPRDIFVKSSGQKCGQIVEDIESQLDKLLGPLMVRPESDNLSNFRRTDAMQDSYRPPVRNNIFSEQSMSVNSDDILNQIINENNTHQSGGFKPMKGRRSAVTYSEEPRESYLTGGDSEDLDDNDFSDVSSIARVVENQASEAHKRSVERIMEILGVDEVEARAYKAILYDAIKKEGDRSNYDRAIELEKRASNKDVLDNISKKDIKNMVKLIDEKHKTRESSSQSDKSSEPVKPKRKVKDVMTSESGLDTISSIDIE